MINYKKLLSDPELLKSLSIYNSKSNKETTERVYDNRKETGKVIINGIDGCICSKCKNFFPYAEPNIDEDTMICYSCRNPME